ncbi:MAG: DUF4430 domain-containing protein [Candidatus Hecatellaceae archaeon]
MSAKVRIGVGGVLAVLLIIFLYITLPPPPPLPSAQTESQTIIIAVENFGHKLIFEEEIQASEGLTAMEALKMVAEVETAYGGKFIVAINGLRSRYPEALKDWFFYVNGFLADKGATDYRLRQGDLIYFSLNYWDFGIPSAIVGGFPKAFTNGYEGQVYPTIVGFEPEFRVEAEKIASYLKSLGVDAVEAKPLAEIERGTEANLILVGWFNSPLIRDFYERKSRLSLFAYPENGKVTILDFHGNKVESLEEAALIQAAKNPWNSKPTILLVIAGNHEKCVEQAVTIVLESPSLLKHASSLAIADDKVFIVPVEG